TQKPRRGGIREMELTTILHRLGADRASEVEYATLRPGGGFDMALKPQEQNANAGELEAAVQRIEQRIDERFAALEALVSRGSSPADRWRPASSPRSGTPRGG